MKAIKKAEKKGRQRQKKESKDKAKEETNSEGENLSNKANFERSELGKSEANGPENNYDDNLTVHEDSCEVTNTFEVKDLVMEAPVQKEKTDNENNSLSVALKASKKTLEESLRNFKKETHVYKAELAKLYQFKFDRDDEMKANRKAEK